MANFFWQRDSFTVEHHQRLQMSLEQNDQWIPNSTDQCCHTHSFQISLAKEKLKGKWGNFTRHLCAKHELCSLNTHPTPARSKSHCSTQLSASSGAKLEITLIELTLLNVCWSKLCNGIALSQEWLKWMKLEATTWTEFITTCPWYFTERTSLKKPKATGKGLNFLTWHASGFHPYPSPSAWRCRCTCKARVLSWLLEALRHHRITYLDIYLHWMVAKWLVVPRLANSLEVMPCKTRWQYMYLSWNALALKKWLSLQRLQLLMNILLSTTLLPCYFNWTQNQKIWHIQSCSEPFLANGLVCTYPRMYGSKGFFSKMFVSRINHFVHSDGGLLYWKH